MLAFRCGERRHEFRRRRDTHCAGLFMRAVRRCPLRRHVRPPLHAIARPSAHLCADAGSLLHLVDVLWLGGAGVLARAGFPADLYRPHSRGGAWFSADRAHRAHRQGAEHHVGGRFRGRAVWQVRAGGRARRVDLRAWNHPLHSAAIEGDLDIARYCARFDGGRPCGGRLLRERDSIGDRGRAAGVFCDGVRHPQHRRHRTSGRPRAGGGDGIAREADRLHRLRRVRDVVDV